MTAASGSGKSRADRDIAKIHVGTSGWNYGHWKRVFYPEGLKPKDWLAFYGRQLATLELNVTFYRGIKEATFEKWRQTVPDDFLFSVKMSRFITHISRLRVERASVERFLGGVSLLEEKLGIILIQLPPSLRFDGDLVSAFFDLLDPAFRYTVEARNESFVGEPFFSLLRARNMAWCISETAGRYPHSEAITADFVYMRLHGRESLYASSYSDDELRGIKGQIEAWGKETFVYFDNDFAGYAPLNALTLKAMCGA
jgi:uncharacterized protein YecE (DUF72 family)